MSIDTNNQRNPSESVVNHRKGHRNTVLATMILTNNRSLADFARQLGLTRQWVSNIVNGLKIPTDAEKLRISKKLSEQMKTNIDTLMLFGKIDDPMWRVSKNSNLIVKDEENK
jgi:transcriptional regulator with XRE-family HTH domain